MINTVTLGDCLQILGKMETNSVDAVLTDPPFKLSQSYSTNVDADNLLAVSIIWPVAVELLRVTKPGGLAAVFYDNRLLPLALNAFKHGGWQYLRTLTLYRRWGNAHMVNGWMSTSDLVLLFTKPGVKPKFNGPCAHDVFVKSGPESDGFNHPAQKPLEFVTQILQNITPVGGVVLDPFGGSGTTAVAAKNSGRNFVLIEKELTYIETANKRIAEHTQQLRMAV